MDTIPILTTSLGLFLLITYVGIGIYLLYLFKIWQESSIGSWTIGALMAGLALLFHLISIIHLQYGASSYLLFYKVATILSFISFWWFGIAHLVSRRYLTDLVLMVLLSIPLGFIIPYIIEQLTVSVENGMILESFSNQFNSFDFLNFLFYGLLYITFARDSHLIYEASIREQADTYRKSIAIGHLLAWQFFAVGTAFLRYLAKFVGTPVYFVFPFILLLVPLLTLGSRPFDWVREGHEPVIIVLIDQYGTPTYSWTRESSTIPLYMEGTTIATISTMLEDFIHDNLTNMVAKFDNYTLYTQNDLGYVSLLVTTGPHKSFEQLLEKIHQILVTDVVKQEDHGIPGYTFPFELKWLLTQLLPNTTYLDDITSIRGLFQKSGFKID